MNKDVKKLLAEHRDEILPDHRVKEKVKRDLGISSVREGRLAYAHGGERAFTSGKKAAVAVVAVLLIAALFLGVFLPLWLSGGGAPPTGQTDPNDPVHPGDGVFGTITDADSFYAYGAASVGSILASAAGGAGDTAAVTASETAPLTAARDAAALAASADEAQVAIVGKYLSLVESLLSDGGIKSTPVEPGMGCEFGMKVESADLIGGTSGYILYYDKIFLGSEVDEGEREDNYSIEGYLVTESATYPVTGNYQTETESEDGEHESESELFFRAYTDEGMRSYIEVTQEYETESEDGETENESEYVYSVYDAGVLVERMTVEYEEEQNELELNMTIERRRADGGYEKEELSFEDEVEDGVRVIAVSGTLDGEPVSFRIYVRGDHYEYVFADGTLDGDRYDDDDDWDDRFDDYRDDFDD